MAGETRGSWERAGTGPRPDAGDGGPRHPTGRAIALMAVVVAALVVLAALSASGRL